MSWHLTEISNAGSLSVTSKRDVVNTRVSASEAAMPMTAPDNAKRAARRSTINVTAPGVALSATRNAISRVRSATSSAASTPYVS
jgi:hypothetical protein